MQRASFKTTDSPAGSQHPEQGPTSTQATLLSCVICAFNFRGCGKSKGRTSWTGEAEREDYQTVIDFLQSGSRSGTFQRKDGEEVGAAGPQKKSSQPTWNRKVFDEMGHEIDLPRLPFISRFILCGFSYGGLVASTISPPLRNPSDPTSRPLPTTYILVSYPAGVAWFLTTGNQGSFHRRAKSILQSESTESPAQEVETSSSSGKTNARKRPVEAYFITGSQDQFTSPNSLLSWLKSNAKLSPPKKLDTSSSWTVTRPDGAIQLDVLHNVDHFWLDHEDELLSRLQAWWKKSHPTNL
ncbi:hypothetical protein BGW38_000825 [Lunasporangiospora selenospora]|uniref:Alpha/beta hydrolase family protein n=1 Tax=Lunasporangiospora selenospora TaxID=979761 RepID=A0A9P6FUA7_9FUNG|nr:hypothetical protein BGW38_000825 [Lunasporangiospora selenospora]